MTAVMDIDTRKYNFSAGPGALPLPVLLQMREELPVYRNAGASVMEISHRSVLYQNLERNARAALRRLLGLSEDWHILFLGGGASLQFHQVPLNFLPARGSADYALTGTWAKKAFKEARLLGDARVAASSEDEAFVHIPTTWSSNPRAAYLHYTSNNTVYGTQYHDLPPTDVPLVCDASSDFLSQPVDLGRHGLIYAGAQKNIGPAGVTVILVKDSFLSARNQPLPTMLDFGTHAARCFNTPPVYAVYVVDKVLGWLERQGGIKAVQRANRQKAQLLYGRIDATEFYRGTAERSSRSRMNVTFRLPSPQLEARFLEEAASAGLLALKGHRSVGGIRASIYNACTQEAVETLVAFMDGFEEQNG